MSRQRTQDSLPTSTTKPAIDDYRHNDSQGQPQGDDDILERPLPAPPETGLVRGNYGAGNGLFNNNTAKLLSPPNGIIENGQQVVHLLFDCWQQRVTGRLDLVGDSGSKTVFFERGVPIDIYSDAPFDTMHEYLLRHGLITRQQYQRVRVKKLEGPRRIAAYLVTEGFLKPQELFSSVRGHLEETYATLFEWEDGRYICSAQLVAEEDRVGIAGHPLALLAEGVRLKFPMDRLSRWVGSPSTLLGPASGRMGVEIDNAFNLENLSFSPAERSVIRLVDGTRSIDDIVFSTGLEAQLVYATLAILLATDAIVVLVAGIENSGSVGQEESDRIDRTRIEDRVEQVRRSDYFNILGVGRHATNYEIERAFSDLQDRFSANHFSGELQAVFGEQIREILQVTEDAYLVLRDNVLRAAYLSHFDD